MYETKLVIRLRDEDFKALFPTVPRNYKVISYIKGLYDSNIENLEGEIYKQITKNKDKYDISELENIYKDLNELYIISQRGKRKTDTVVITTFDNYTF